MVRNVDYESRKRAVLLNAINRHIQEAIPVASEDLAEEFDLSPATIRSILSDLEEDGYLAHPYTSGGKIPTGKGYRYYVDMLLSQADPLYQEKADILKEYKQEIRRLEQALEQTSEIISRLTHYASIVSFMDLQDKLFYKGISFIMEQPEFQDVQRLRLLMQIIEDKKRLLNMINQDFEDKVKVYIGSELGYPEMKNFSLAISSYRLKNKFSGKVAVLGPIRMHYKQIIPTLGHISEVLTELLEGI